MTTDHTSSKLLNKLGIDPANPHGAFAATTPPGSEFDTAEWATVLEQGAQLCEQLCLIPADTALADRMAVLTALVMAAAEPAAQRRGRRRLAEMDDGELLPFLLNPGKLVELQEEQVVHAILDVAVALAERLIQR